MIDLPGPTITPAKARADFNRLAPYLRVAIKAAMKQHNAKPGSYVFRQYVEHAERVAAYGTQLHFDFGEKP